MKERWKLYNEGTIHAKRIDNEASKQEKKRRYEYQLVGTYIKEQETTPRILLARTPSTIDAPSCWLIAVVIDRKLEDDVLGRVIVKHWDVHIEERIPVTKYISRTRAVAKERSARLLKSLPDSRHTE